MLSLRAMRVVEILLRRRFRSIRLRTFSGVVTRFFFFFWWYICMYRSENYFIFSFVFSIHFPKKCFCFFQSKRFMLRFVLLICEKLDAVVNWCEERVIIWIPMTFRDLSVSNNLRTIFAWISTVMIPIFNINKKLKSVLTITFRHTKGHSRNWKLILLARTTAHGRTIAVIMF